MTVMSEIPARTLKTISGMTAAVTHLMITDGVCMSGYVQFKTLTALLCNARQGLTTLEEFSGRVGVGVISSLIVNWSSCCSLPRAFLRVQLG